MKRIVLTILMMISLIILSAQNNMLANLTEPNKSTEYISNYYDKPISNRVAQEIIKKEDGSNLIVTAFIKNRINNEINLRKLKNIKFQKRKNRYILLNPFLNAKCKTRRVIIQQIVPAYDWQTVKGSKPLPFKKNRTFPDFFKKYSAKFIQRKWGSVSVEAIFKQTLISKTDHRENSAFRYKITSENASKQFSLSNLFVAVTFDFILSEPQVKNIGRTK